MYEDVRGTRGGLARLGDDLLGWLRTRPTEHWLMFVAGLALGLAIG